MKRLLTAGLILLCGFLYAQEATPGEAHIRETSGTVEVKAPGAANWRAAQTGERITGDTMISTSFRSTAVVELGNSSLLVLPLTRLTLTEIINMQEDESVNLQLHAGRVRAEVNPPVRGRTNFTVSSSMVTASVRGTAFDFDGINLSVDEGTVYYFGQDGIGTYVAAGHQAAYDTETGKTVGAAELIRAELTLTPAAGEGFGAAAPSIPQVTIINFEWND
jgi:hypothetical protein